MIVVLCQLHSLPATYIIATYSAFLQESLAVVLNAAAEHWKLRPHQLSSSQTSFTGHRCLFVVIEGCLRLGELSGRTQLPLSYHWRHVRPRTRILVRSAEFFLCCGSSCLERCFACFNPAVSNTRPTCLRRAATFLDMPKFYNKYQSLCSFYVPVATVKIRYGIVLFQVAIQPQL